MMLYCGLKEGLSMGSFLTYERGRLIHYQSNDTTNSMGNADVGYLINDVHQARVLT